MYEYSYFWLLLRLYPHICSNEPPSHVKNLPHKESTRSITTDEATTQRNEQISRPTTYYRPHITYRINRISHTVSTTCRTYPILYVPHSYTVPTTFYIAYIQHILPCWSACFCLYHSQSNQPFLWCCSQAHSLPPGCKIWPQKLRLWRRKRKPLMHHPG